MTKNEKKKRLNAHRDRMRAREKAYLAGVMSHSAEENNLDFEDRELTFLFNDESLAVRNNEKDKLADAILQILFDDKTISHLAETTGESEEQIITLLQKCEIIL